MIDQGLIDRIDRNRAECSLAYLRDVKKLARRMDDMRAIYGQEDGWRRDIVGSTIDETYSKLMDATEVVNRLDDDTDVKVLTCLYILGYPGEETGDKLGYSESHIWEIARHARQELYDHIPDRYKTP